MDFGKRIHVMTRTEITLNRPALLHLLPVFILLIWAAVSDLRERRIRNWLTLTLVITGIAQSFMPAHSATPAHAVLGLLAGGGITFILFALRALGGGDVKLLAGVGTWLGPIPVLAVFVIAALIGMVIVLAQAVWQGRLKKLMHNSALVAVNLIHLNEVGVEHVVATGQGARSVDRPLPYAVPVLCGVALLAIKSYVLRGA